MVSYAESLAAAARRKRALAATESLELGERSGRKAGSDEDEDSMDSLPQPDSGSGEDDEEGSDDDDDQREKAPKAPAKAKGKGKARTPGEPSKVRCLVRV